MKTTSIAAITAILLTALAGCSTVTMTTFTPSETPAASPSTSAASATQQLCSTAFADKTLLAWVPSTVGSLRTYQYGGPRANVPLKDAFPGVSSSTAAAWCGVKQAADSIAWWGVVDGQAPVHAITITGPGSGKYVGETTQNALQVP
jgi:hypothetical protein